MNSWPYSGTRCRRRPARMAVEGRAPARKEYRATTAAPHGAGARGDVRGVGSLAGRHQAPGARAVRRRAARLPGHAAQGQGRGGAEGRKAYPAREVQRAAVRLLFRSTVLFVAGGRVLCAHVLDTPDRDLRSRERTRELGLSAPSCEAERPPTLKEGRPGMARARGLTPPQRRPGGPASVVVVIRGHHVLGSGVRQDSVGQSSAGPRHGVLSPRPKALKDPPDLAVTQRQDRGRVAARQLSITHPPHHHPSLHLPGTHRCSLHAPSS